jgi:hypothetical protein
MPVEELKKKGLRLLGGGKYLAPYALLYEYGIEPLDALFTR